MPVGVPVFRGVQGAVARRLMAGYTLTVALLPSVRVVDAVTFMRLYLEEEVRGRDEGGVLSQ